MQRQFLYIFILFLAMILNAKTTKADTAVYFFDYKLPNGDIYSFDKGGRFYHAALKYKNKILEANPYYGVRLASNINQVGHLVAILKSKKSVTNFDSKVQAQIGKKFDLYSAWDDPNTTQCSKLIGQIIGVSPVIVQGGNLSLSPDLLYAELEKQGFTECQSCLLQH